MEQYSVAETKKNLSQILGAVSFAKTTVEITKHGKPIARIVPVDDGAGDPPFDKWPGWLSEKDLFFSTMEDIVATRHFPRVLDEN